MLHAFAKALAFIVLGIFAPTKVCGKENIKNGNVIFVCNHQSMVDAFINFLYLPSNTHFMAKKELFSNKFFAGVLKKINVFPVNRGKADITSVKHACEVLKQNNNLCIFPQGTRRENPNIEESDMHSGIGMLLLKEKSTVVPMMFPRKPGFFKKNTLYIGAPLDMTEFEGEKFNSATMSRAAQKVGEEMNKLLCEEKQKLLKETK